MTTRSTPRAKRAVAPIGKKATRAKLPAKLRVAMTGKASPPKAEEGDEPVFAYIASLPQPQRDIAERVAALAAKTPPDLQRAFSGAWRTTVATGAGVCRPAHLSAM